MRILIIALVMLFSVVTTAVEEPNTTQASASEIADISDGLNAFKVGAMVSQFHHVPAVDMTTVEFSMGLAGERLSGNNNERDVQSFDIMVQHSLAENFHANIGIGYVDENYSAKGVYHDSRGLTDVRVGFGYTTMRNDWNLILGSQFRLSPGSQVAPTNTTVGNQFSGGMAIAPFFGFEREMGGGYVGGRFAIDKELGYDFSGPVDPTITLNGFYEFPLSESVDLGVSVGFGREGNYSWEKQWVNLYMGSLYTNFFINDVTAISAEGTIRSLQENRTSTTLTEMRVGVRRSL